MRNGNWLHANKIKEKEMTKKLSVVRFKPKPECFHEFLQNIQAWQSQVYADGDHLLMCTDEEVVAVVIRDSGILHENIQRGVAWLDSQRPLLQEYNEVDRHTLPITGDLVV
jgi:hypothetical protein